MNTHHFNAEITRRERMAADHGALARAADRDVWNSAAEALRDRIYRTDAGMVRVRVEWPPHNIEPSIGLRIEVTDQREGGHAREIPSFVELFFHEAFLLFNIAVPGSFGGVIAASGREYRVHEIALDARIFETAWVAAVRDGGPVTLPLTAVVAWYDSLGIGTQQVARDGIAGTLFHLLHLARGPEDEVMTIVRLAGAHELRDAVIGAAAPVIHPMHDEVLDPQVEEIDWTEAADRAASTVVADLQSRVKDSGGRARQGAELLR